MANWRKTAGELMAIQSSLHYPNNVWGLLHRLGAKKSQSHRKLLPASVVPVDLVTSKWRKSNLQPYPTSIFLDFKLD